MIALDTNILARLVAVDDLRQHKAVVKLIGSGQACFVPLTVSLELEWVLRGRFGFDRRLIIKIFQELLRGRDLHFEREADVLEAIRLHDAGLDFADALHLLTSSQCDELVTFDDQRFAARANRLSLKPPCRVLRS